jgi:uncharacterized integral membrane protein
MTDARPQPSAEPSATDSGLTAPPPQGGPVEPTTTAPSPTTPTRRDRSREGLGHTRTSGIWAAVVCLVVLLVLLAIFVLQNVQQVQVSYFGWEGRAPLAAALLIAAASGAVIAVVAGALRILQLRRRVRRAQKR